MPDRAGRPTPPAVLPPPETTPTHPHAYNNRTDTGGTPPPPSLPQIQKYSPTLERDDRVRVWLTSAQTANPVHLTNPDLVTNPGPPPTPQAPPAPPTPSALPRKLKRPRKRVEPPAQDILPAASATPPGATELPPPPPLLLPQAVPTQDITPHHATQLPTPHHAMQLPTPPALLPLPTNDTHEPTSPMQTPKDVLPLPHPPPTTTRTTHEPSTRTQSESTDPRLPPPPALRPAQREDSRSRTTRSRPPLPSLRAAGLPEEVSANGLRTAGSDGVVAREASRTVSEEVRSRLERVDRIPSTASQFSRGASAHPQRRPSERMTAFPSDLGEFERVVSEHFSRAGSHNGTAQAQTVVQKSDSALSNAPLPTNLSNASGNPLAALRVTFMSVRSFGNTEKSSGSLGDDGCFGSGLFRQGFSALGDGSFLGNTASLRKSFPLAWSSPGLPLASKVADAAGSLYRSECLDEHWSIGNKVGAGACSEVRLGESKDGARRVAIKIVWKGAPDLFSPSGECREVVAFKIAGKHPNVVACHEVFEDDRFVYLVLELLVGGQMLPRIAAKQFYPRYCENDIVTLVRGLTKGLAHLHELGIAHRDVKPENVLFATDTLDPTIKLTDFGIAHTQCLTNDARDMVGTPLYVAPEVLLRRPYGCQADMWSLGVIVHILLTGYPPFDDDDLVQLVNLVKCEQVRIDGDEWVIVSDAARDFVSRLLTREVSKRLTASTALAHPWLASPRPPPFPAPSPVHASEGSPSPSSSGGTAGIPSVMASKQDGMIPLLVAQANLHSFVMRKEWKRIVQSEGSERNLELSMLVSLSEKDLKISESFASREGVESAPVDTVNFPPGSRMGTARRDERLVNLLPSPLLRDDGSVGGAYSAEGRSPTHGRRSDTDVEEEAPGGRKGRHRRWGSGGTVDTLAKGQEGGKRRAGRTKKKVSDASTDVSVGTAHGRKEGSVNGVRVDRESSAGLSARRRSEDVNASHQREQELLRQKRLQLQADLSRKRRQSEAKRKSSSADGGLSIPGEDQSVGADYSKAGCGGGSSSGRGRRVGGDAKSTDGKSVDVKSLRSTGRRTEGTSEWTGSVSSGELSGSSSASSFDGVDETNELMLTNSKFSDDSAEWLKERRDADAQEDVERVQKRWWDGGGVRDEGLSHVGGKTRVGAAKMGARKGKLNVGNQMTADDNSGKEDSAAKVKAKGKAKAKAKRKSARKGLLRKKKSSDEVAPAC